ncbi:MAG: hypothetical protein V4476_25445 [Pseudomonadota bacterium]
MAAFRREGMVVGYGNTMASGPEKILDSDQKRPREQLLVFLIWVRSR